ncbi:hypothetical protein Ga0080574_TMP1618 [Salipiger abyssi]|uniref:Uncharacterized protein n=1 Tax=Salipiger abyssi TaxID=1250539 RepID=A0A1P8URD6_9RHOB|nr:hypothetical protein Ga0080574_TMP1618 [Salipiger abyssi]
MGFRQRCRFARAGSRWIPTSMSRSGAHDLNQGAHIRMRA